MTGERSSRRRDKFGFLKGQLLVAMPIMTDRRFARSVIYMCAHSEEGAMGLIVNFPANHITFPDLLTRLGITNRNGEEGISADLLERQVHVGGPVEPGRGFVLHSPDYYAQDSTLAIDDGINLTASVDILKAIAAGAGPKHALLALGYAGWAAGQLETEIQANGWLHCQADEALVFDTDLDSKYIRALAKIGIDPSHLVADAGHA